MEYTFTFESVDGHTKSVKKAKLDQKVELANLVMKAAEWGNAERAAFVYGPGVRMSQCTYFLANRIASGALKTPLH